MLRVLNRYLLPKSDSEKIAFYILAFIVSMALGYILFFDHSYKILNENIDKHYEATNEFKTFNNRANKDNFDILNKQKLNLQKSKDELNELNERNSNIQDKLRDISFLLPSNQNWAKFLDDIINLAKQNHIEIQNMQNDFKDPVLDKIHEVLNIKINARADFQNILSYINDIESSKPFARINNIVITHDLDHLKIVFEIGIWGFEYR